jgi:hypothetical protein
VSDLQTALAAANPGDEIWIAAGSYTPGATSGNNEGATFVIPSGVRIYGGFSGTETSPDERPTDPAANTTRLSGAGYFRRVVTISGASDQTLLDRLTISDGTGGVQPFADVASAQSGPAMAILAGSHVRLSNITFTNNTSGRLTPVQSAGMRGLPGGAVYVDQSSPVFVNCTFFGNVASDGGASSCGGGGTSPGGDGGDGGAVAAFESTLRFSECAFVSNQAGRGGDGASCSTSAGTGGAGGRGGAIFASNTSVEMFGCQILGNRSGSGGLGARAILGATVISQGGAAGGGGAIVMVGGSLTLSTSTLTDNRAGDAGGPGSNAVSALPGLAGGDGGAVMSVGGTVTVINSVLAKNRAGNGSSATFSALATPCGLAGGNAGTGGAVFVSAATLSVRASTITGNLPGAAGAGSSPAPSFCGSTPACCSSGPPGASGAGGVRASGSTVAVSGSILWANGGGQLSGSAATVEASCVQGGVAGSGNINTDPLFVNFAGGDYRLSAGSACIDLGTGNGLPDWLNADAAGRPRFVSGCGVPSLAAGRASIDMGALEFQGASDCNADGLCDAAQVRGTQLLAPLSPAGNTFFGWSLGAEADTAIVGARFDSPLAPGSGSATVFQRFGEVWLKPAYLLPPELGASSNYGNQIVVTRQFAFVAARTAAVGGAANAGAVYVFRRHADSWVFVQRLVAPDPVSGMLFGHGLSASGSRVAVGALAARVDMLPGAGAAYVYRLEGSRFVLEAKLAAPDARIGGGFGISVGLSGNRLVCGAPSYDPGAGPTASGAYVFERFGSSWLPTAKLLSPQAQAADVYGESVVISGDTLVVGASRLNVRGKSQAGAAFVYRRSGTGWSLPAQLNSNEPGASEFFGFGLAIRGDRLLIGGFNRAVGGQAGAGAVYVFQRISGNTWLMADRIDNPTPEENAAFGYWPAFAGTRALVGGFRNTNQGVPLGGGVWSFPIDRALDIDDNLVPDACDIAAGTYTDRDGNGIPDGLQFNPCRADFNSSGTVSNDDIFVYLNAWFVTDPRCDLNGTGGVNIDDIFLFLNLWFAGC